MTQLKTKNEKLEYTNDEKKKLVLEINTGDSEKVTEWFKVIQGSKSALSSSDLNGAKQELKNIISSVLCEKTFDKIVKFCNNNFMCILTITLDIVEVVTRSQLAYKDEVDKRVEAMKKLK